MTAESVASLIKSRHGLTSLHIFDEPGRWRAFGFRKDPKGFQASVAEGVGVTIEDALRSLDQRLTEGPIPKT